MKREKIALIFGITGQDGSYLANFLIRKNYKVIGITRNLSAKNLFRLKKLNILKKIKLIKGIAVNINFIKEIIKKNKNIKEIYYLAGCSSVVNSFLFPEESLRSNAIGISNILVSVKNINKKIKVFNAASGQFYGNNKKSIYNEKSYINPQSPYGISKASSYWLVKIFRERYGINCCSGILFNHESPLRSDAFVTKKIINHCHLIKKRKIKYLYVGDINISRDWGWAPEYIEAMYLMLRQKDPKDLVIGSGKRHSLKRFIFEAFRLLKIPRNRLKANTKKLIRRNDIRSYRSDPRLAKKILNWKAKTSFKQIIKKMICDELF
jgi:GDPmannose 4,6-dehydratase